MMMLRGARGKAILWLGIFSLISASLFFSTLDLGRSLSTQLVYLRGTLTGDASLALEETCHEPLKVYMYDIPSRFNMGMLKPDGKLKLPWVDKRFPPWPERSGLKKQHSIEYWMMASLLNETQGRREDRAAVRVADPEQADVFFMPFFASLSFNIHGKTMTDPETEKDRQLQVEVLRMLRKSPWWQRSEGRDHVLVLHHPNAFRFLRDELYASILIVADFGRFPKNVSRLMKDVVAPYAHVVDTYSDDNKWDPYGSRPTLLFFRGRTIRKAGGAVRKRLVRILQNQSRVTFEDSMASPQGFDLSTVGMRSSKFCLHPAGDTPSSCRLFDAIVSHCVPVIVSDQIELPFEDELDYREFCLFFSVNEAIEPGYLLRFLNAFPKKKWLQMWQRLREVSHHFEFQHPSRKDDAVNMIWKQVQRKAPAVKLAVHRSKRLKIPDWWRYF